MQIKILVYANKFARLQMMISYYLNENQINWFYLDCGYKLVKHDPHLQMAMMRKSC